MNRKSHFISPAFEKTVGSIMAFVVLATQINLPLLISLLIPLLFPTPAHAARLGTSTVSSGSAPPPAASTTESFQPDLFTGRATTGIPIAVPPGRKGVQPSLALGYSSSSRNGGMAFK